MRIRQAIPFLGACALDVGAGTAAAKTPDGPIDVCTLLTVDEAAKTLGQPVGEGTPSTRELPGTRLQLVASLQSNCANPDPKTCFTADKRVAQGKHEEKDLKKIAAKRAEKRL